MTQGTPTIRIGWVPILTQPFEWMGKVIYYGVFVPDETFEADADGAIRFPPARHTPTARNLRPLAEPRRHHHARHPNPGNTRPPTPAGGPATPLKAGSPQERRFLFRREGISSSRYPALPLIHGVVNRPQNPRPNPRRRLDGGPRHAPHPAGVIRTAARAVIVRDGKILTVVLRDREGDFHVLPGGGQSHGETLAETVYRECLEEIGARVNIGNLLYIREYVGANHGFAQRHAHFHQVEAVFTCELLDEPRADRGTARDNRQVGLAWIPLADLPRFRFFPTILKDFVKNGAIEVPVTYLGDIN